MTLGQTSATGTCEGRDLFVDTLWVTNMKTSGHKIKMVGVDVDKFWFRNNYLHTYEKRKNKPIVVMMAVFGAYSMTDGERVVCKNQFRNSIRAAHRLLVIDGDEIMLMDDGRIMIYSINPKMFMFVLMIADTRMSLVRSIIGCSDVVLYNMALRKVHQKPVRSLNMIEYMINSDLMSEYNCGSTDPITLMCPNTMVSRHTHVMDMMYITAFICKGSLKLMTSNMLMRTNDNTYCTGYINLTKDLFDNVVIKDIKLGEARTTNIEFMHMHTITAESLSRRGRPGLSDSTVTFSLPPLVTRVYTDKTTIMGCTKYMITNGCGHIRTDLIEFVPVEHIRDAHQGKGLGKRHEHPCHHGLGSG
ncbi:hypothetical protein AYO20_08427 [Fonsecaea nubica]|uniref:Uncharacterized protein n=1 Tax=Fonsecaea nubica TaxID=856822 RepID=A0A178CNU4_9EURO|nr:hypothetical protein AYO20_08427 [Fonsecaea nubica]OAL31096.1 hypothetical protein AYO20_08427 [Fonsecaea nubica]